MTYLKSYNKRIAYCWDYCGSCKYGGLNRCVVLSTKHSVNTEWLKVKWVRLKLINKSSNNEIISLSQAKGVLMCYSKFCRLASASILVDHPFWLLVQKSTSVFVSTAFTSALLLCKPSVTAALLWPHVLVSDDASEVASYGRLIYATLFANVALKAA